MVELGIEVPEISEILDIIPPECAEYVDQIQAQLESLFGAGATRKARAPTAVRLPADFVSKQVASLDPAIQEQVVKQLERFSPRREWEGTKARPHVFVYGIQDLSGLKPAEQVVWDRVRNRLRQARDEACFTDPQSKRCWNLMLGFEEFDAGNIPFSFFRNLGDDRLWGKFYNRASGVVWIDQVDIPFSIFARTPKGRVVQVAKGLGWSLNPLDWPEGIYDALVDALEAIGDAAEWLGDAIVWVFDIALEALVLLCDLYAKAKDIEAVKAARCMIAVAAAMGEPTSAVASEFFEAADRICEMVAVVDAVVNAEVPPPAELPGDTAEDRLAVFHALKIASSVLLPFVIYPPTAFAIFDPSISKYRILAVS